MELSDLSGIITSEEMSAFLIAMQTITVRIIRAMDDWILIYFFGINAHYLILMVIGYEATMRSVEGAHLREKIALLQSPLAPPISVLVPVYNEEANVVSSVRSLMLIKYPRFEIVVVNDGSKDNTLEVLIERFGLIKVSRSYDPVVRSESIRGVYESKKYDNLVVVDKDNGGKGDALNAGINISKYPLFCAIDGDSLLEPDALIQVALPFMDDRKRTVASGGIIRIANGCEIKRGHVSRVQAPKNTWAGIQVVEYLRAFLFGRMGWSRVGGLLLIAGAFGLFEKKAVVEAGGYAHNTVGEDLELVMRLHRLLHKQGREYRFSYVPEPVCWTEAPETLGDLGRQRNRWYRGLADVLWRYRDMMGNPRYKMVGLVALPSQLFFELFAPFVELLGWLVIPISYLTGIVDLDYLLVLFTVAILYSILVSIAAIVLEDRAFGRYSSLWDLGRLVFLAAVENFGYRQLNTWWKLCGFVDFLRGKGEWGSMTRKGVETT